MTHTPLAPDTHWWMTRCMDYEMGLDRDNSKKLEDQDPDSIERARKRGYRVTELGSKEWVHCKKCGRGHRTYQLAKSCCSKMYMAMVPKEELTSIT